MENSIYKQALQQGLRFNLKGVISTEDLWALKLQDLDEIYKGLDKELKQSTEVSLLNVVTKQSTQLELKMAIVKDVVETKLADKEKAKNRAQRSAQRAKLQAALADKEESALSNMTEAELKAQLQALDDE